MMKQGFAAALLALVASTAAFVAVELEKAAFRRRRTTSV